jgi:AbrB family looped-hinge helix DNA binding protein
MAKGKLSTKGQLTLPKTVRDARNWRPGMEFEVVDLEDGVLFKPASVKKRYTLDDLCGCLPYSGPPKTLEEMERGIDEAMRERWARKSGLD